MLPIESRIFKSRLLQISKELESGKCDIKDKKGINNEINIFLYSQDAVQYVVENFPELGHVFCRLLEDDDFLLRPDVGATVFSNLLWFYRPQSVLEVETQATNWAQALFRRAFSACNALQSSLFYEMKWTEEKELTKLNDFILLFHSSMDYFAGRNEVLEAVCCLCTVLLNHNKVSNQKIETLMELLPKSSNKNSTVQRFLKTLSKHLMHVENEDHLKRCLAIKYHAFMEAVILKQLAHWLSDREKLRENWWLVSLVSESRNEFFLVVQILHAVFVKFQHAMDVELFINHFIKTIRCIKGSIHDLYPMRMSAVICLLEENPSPQLADLVFKILITAVDEHLISVDEALMLTTHFREWNQTMNVFLQKRANHALMLRRHYEMR